MIPPLPHFITGLRLEVVDIFLHVTWLYAKLPLTDSYCLNIENKYLSINK